MINVHYFFYWPTKLIGLGDGIWIISHFILSIFFWFMSVNSENILLMFWMW
jgi:hypothetical protein